MGNALSPRIGGTLSADIAVPEHDRETKFYARVLTTGSEPLWREDLLNNRGTPIIGLGARTPEYETLPLLWMPHIQVADVGASVQRALDRNATEVMHGKDDEGNSQWAVLFDPEGTPFGLIPVPTQDQAPAVEDDAVQRTGHITGIDLTVPDAAKTRDFYSAVVGWSAQELERNDNGERYVDYTMLCPDGHPGAVIRHARGAHAGVPKAWMIHLPVGDLAESLSRAKADGGKIVHRSTTADGRDARAIIEDPVGVSLALVPG